MTLWTKQCPLVEKKINAFINELFIQIMVYIWTDDITTTIKFCGDFLVTYYY